MTLSGEEKSILTGEQYMTLKGDASSVMLEWTAITR